MKKVFTIMALFLMTAVSAVNVNAKNKAAFLSTYASLADLQTNGDDDEIAAANWFVNTYGGSYLSVSQIGTADLSQYNVIWIAIERDHGFSNFPAELTNSAVISAIFNYYSSGGNLLLTNYAIKYLADLGRANNIFGDLWEDGSITPDSNDATYGTIPVFGRFFTNGDTEFSKGAIDHSNDPLYTGLISEIRSSDVGIKPYTYTFYPLIGAGQKEVHRVVWTADCSLNSGISGGIDNPAFLTSFETDLNMEAIATVEYTLAYFRVAIGRWLPQGDFQGKAITISDTGYEWNQNSGANPFQSNIERLTKNALDELGGTISGIQPVSIQSANIYISNNVLYTMNNDFVSAEMYNVNGKLLAQYDATQIATGINVSAISRGVYLVCFKDINGAPFSAKFVK